MTENAETLGRAGQRIGSTTTSVPATVEEEAGAGLGERPRAEPIRGVDAYFWIKPPGESDGISDPTQPRYDGMCANRDAAPGAPQAGQWFESYFVDLVRNALPAL